MDNSYPHDSVSFHLNCVVIHHGADSDVQIYTQSVHVHKTKKSHYHQNISFGKAEFSATITCISLSIRICYILALLTAPFPSRLKFDRRAFTELATY